MPRTFTRTITTPAAARMVRPNARPVVTLLTDFGSRDPSAGLMRAVVLGIAPEALVIDISHEVEKFRVRDAALVLWSSVPYLPHGAHVAVVDPGVGTERRAVAMETARGDFLVGPDNGILMPAASRLGGITRVHQLTSAQYRLPVISSSFHGRDLFAPAAAHLAMGLPLEFLGPALDPRQLMLLDWPEPQVFAGILRSQVIYLDTFGNVKLSALAPDLGAALGAVGYGERVEFTAHRPVRLNDVEVTWVETFARVAVGQPLLYEDSYGRLSVAVDQGSAVQAIGIREDAEVLITRQPLPRVDDGLGSISPARRSPRPFPSGPGRRRRGSRRSRRGRRWRPPPPTRTGASRSRRGCNSPTGPRSATGPGFRRSKRRPRRARPRPRGRRLQPVSRRRTSCRRRAPTHPLRPTRPTGRPRSCRRMPARVPTLGHPRSARSATWSPRRPSGSAAGSTRLSRQHLRFGGGHHSPPSRPFGHVTGPVGRQQQPVPVRGVVREHRDPDGAGHLGLDRRHERPCPPGAPPPQRRSSACRGRITAISSPPYRYTSSVSRPASTTLRRSAAATGCQPRGLRDR